MSAIKLTLIFGTLCSAILSFGDESPKEALRMRLYEKLDETGSFTAYYQGVSTNGTTDIVFKYNKDRRQIQSVVRKVGAEETVTIAVDYADEKAGVVCIERPDERLKLRLSDGAVFNPVLSLNMFLAVYSLYREYECGRASGINLSSEFFLSTSPTGGDWNVRFFYLSDIPLQLSWIECLKSDSFDSEESGDQVILHDKNGRKIVIDAQTGLLVSDTQPEGIPHINLIRLEKGTVNLDAEISALSQKASSLSDQFIYANDVSILKQINTALPSNKMADFLQQNHASVQDAMYAIGRNCFTRFSKDNADMKIYIDTNVSRLKKDGVGYEQWSIARPNWIEAFKKMYMATERENINAYLKTVSVQGDSLDVIKEFCLPMVAEGYVAELVSEIERRAGLTEEVKAPR